MRELWVYGRSGCHLCDFVVDELRPRCEAAGVRLQVLDVDDRPEWRERFGLRVPVVCDGAVEISGWPLDRRRVDDWLGASQRGEL